MEDKLKIIVKIAGREYPTWVERNEEGLLQEEKIRRAAKQINDIVAKYRLLRYEADPTDYIAMAALQIAVQNVENQMNDTFSNVKQEVEDIEKQIDDMIRSVSSELDKK